jgi:hypothetical protein
MSFTAIDSAALAAPYSGTIRIWLSHMRLLASAGEVGLMFVAKAPNVGSGRGGLIAEILKVLSRNLGMLYNQP